jgi:peptidoglycan L-alanyl-D-glutamate endopeptidase CwlK
MSTKLEDLTPDTQAKAQAALDDCAAQGIPVVVTYTLRTEAEQAALYAQGRQPLIAVNALRAAAGLALIGNADNSYTVTNASGKRIADGGTGRSEHQLGIALDVCPLENGEAVWPSIEDPRWAQIAAVFKGHGFAWGGDWTKEKDGIDPDFPHYEIDA